MLPRSQRLKSSEFELAFKNGRPLRHPLLQLRVWKRDESTHSEAVRAAFVAPKKLGKATLRNRLRRRVRERYRLLMQAEYSQKLAEYDLVWIIRSAVEKVGCEELEDALKELLRRAARNVNRPPAGNEQLRTGLN